MADSGKPVTVEGNICEIDFDNKFFTLSGKDHAPFIKIYWRPAHEEKMKKQKVGYYEAPTVEMDEPGVGGSLKEGFLSDLPYKERPADYPRLPRPGGAKGSGGRPYQPRNEKPIIYQVCYKEACETARRVSTLQTQSKTEAHTHEEIFNSLMNLALARAKHDAEELIKAAGVQ